MMNAKEVEAEAVQAIGTAVSPDDLEKCRVLYLGKKGKVTELFHAIKDCTPDERKIIGQEVNAVRDRIQAILDERVAAIKNAVLEKIGESERIDISMPGILPAQGSLHPLTLVYRDIVGFFSTLGFAVAEGPEIETEYYNFEALNIPPNHPSRDMWDTLYLKGGDLLRTHTSPVQIRVLESVKPPLRFLFPGRVYRRDQIDASHAMVFHQIEGLLIDQKTSFAELKGVLSGLVRHLFGKDRGVRFIPSYYPFTEPSADICLECSCRMAGCPICKGSGWIEVLGCGMVHPRVLEMQKLDPRIWQGFAFGLGWDRFAMLKYGIPDLRLFLENHQQFLRQF